MMISTICILGQASDPIEGYNTYRMVDVESREPFDENSFYCKIPVMYWDRSARNPLMKIPNGHFVVIFGRLERHPELGLYVLAEQIRHFSSNLKVHYRGYENAGQDVPQEPMKVDFGKFDKNGSREL